MDVNVDEIEKNAQKALADDVIEYDDLDKDPAEPIVDDPKDEFNLDSALDDFSMVSLDGKVSKEEAEEKAAERGWREDGKDKFGHKISAIEFLERAPLFHKMDLMKGDIDKQNKQIKSLMENSKKIAEKSINDKKKLLEDFQKEKETLLSTELLDSDDIKKLKVIDKKIEDNQIVDDVTSEDDKVAAYTGQLDKFKAENEWYGKNRAMAALADAVGRKYAQDYIDENGELPDPAELFKHVMGEVEIDFPDMGKPKKNNRVASRRDRTVIKNHRSKKSLSDLPDDQQAIAKEVMEAAGLSEEDYLKAYEV